MRKKRTNFVQKCDLFIPSEIKIEEERIDQYVRYIGATRKTSVRNDDDADLAVRTILFDTGAYEDALIELIDSGLDPNDFSFS